MASSPEVVEPVANDDGLETALAEAVAGVDDPRLAAILRTHWHQSLRRSPMWATRMGVHRYDDRLARIGPEVRESARRLRGDLRARVSTIPIEGLSERDQVHLRSFLAKLDDADATAACRFAMWNLSARGNVVTSANSMARRHRVESVADGRRLVARYGQVAARIDASIDDLRAGKAEGRVANRESLRRVVESLDRQLAGELSASPLMVPARAEHAAWSATDLERFRGDLARRVQFEIRPAIRRLRAVLADELLPVARTGTAIGVSSLPDGGACYEALITRYTSLDFDARTLHETGLAEMRRINGEMRVIGRRLFSTSKLEQILRRLRSDPKLHFETAEQVREFAEATLRAAEAKVASAFSRAPKAPCTVVEIPEQEAPYTTIAYYSGPAPDGSKPGEYFINTHAPTTRPRYEARVLAVHEAVPGHHLQIAWAQELEALPAFRRYGGQTVFVEGWALYSERLADEMGLYVDDLDRMGVLSFDAWRAARLVVDTGIHAFGWSRERAIRYLTEHTALAPNNIDNEVDRYISWPGQALAYKVGQLQILELRAEAEARLGDRFDLREFHDVVLGAGAISIPNLRRRVRAYLETKNVERSLRSD